MKKLLAAMIAIFAVGTSVSAYAYWDDLESTSNETMEVGEGTTLVVNETVSAPAGKVLVPNGVVMKANDVDSITLEYTVNLDQTALNDLTLNVGASNVLIDGATANTELLNIDISQTAPTVNDTLVTVTVVVTLSEPADEATYLAVINGVITFDLTFTGVQ